LCPWCTRTSWKCADISCERKSHMHRNHTFTGCAHVHWTRMFTGFTGINLRPGWRLPEGDPDAGSRRGVYRKQNYTGACYRYTYLRSTLHTLRSGMFPLLVWNREDTSSRRLNIEQKIIPIDDFNHTNVL